MPLQLTKAEFLANAAKLYDTLDTDLNDDSQSFYEYEATYVAHLQAFSKENLAQSISKVSDDPRKKKDTE